MKDWTGTSASAFKQLGASNHTNDEREENDYYATDPTAIDDLVRVEDLNTRIWEPACGEGHLAKRLTELGYDVTATDLIDRGYGNGNFTGSSAVCYAWFVWEKGFKGDTTVKWI